MWKILGIVGVILVLLVSSFFIFTKWMAKSDVNYVLKRLEKDKENSSILFKENGNVQADIRSSKMMSLASTVKIMVAIEYAFQVAEGEIDRKEAISLKDLDLYYLPKMDGGAHETWINYGKEKGIIQNETVTLQEVARGMMMFSSNANTEYLMEKLGINRIEKRMKDLGIKDHSPLFFFEAATFIPLEIKRDSYKNSTMKESKEKILSKLRSLSEEEWIKQSEKIHKRLASDPLYKKEAKVLEWWDVEYDQLFSERFIKSTALEYANIMSKINNNGFPKFTQDELEYVMGGLMENPKNKEWLKRAGRKGGSTVYILTEALFAEDKKGNKYELAIFFNRLQWYQSRKLMASLNEFELKLLTDEKFRKKLHDLSESQ